MITYLVDRFEWPNYAGTVSSGARASQRRQHPPIPPKGSTYRVLPQHTAKQQTREAHGQRQQRHQQEGQEENQQEQQGAQQQGHQQQHVAHQAQLAPAPSTSEPGDPTTMHNFRKPVKPWSSAYTIPAELASIVQQALPDCPGSSMPLTVDVVCPGQPQRPGLQCTLARYSRPGSSSVDFRLRGLCKHLPGPAWLLTGLELGPAGAAGPWRLHMQEQQGLRRGRSSKSAPGKSAGSDSSDSSDSSEGSDGSEDSASGSSSEESESEEEELLTAEQRRRRRKEQLRSLKREHEITSA